MNAIAQAARPRRTGATPSRWFDAIVSASARTRIGTSPVQNFDHRNDESRTGDVRTIQNAGPSADTAGNTKRTATAAVTNAAIARLKNA